jgi:UDP-N-acetylglucosamine 1-carboxyvinyltransferase
VPDDLRMIRLAFKRLGLNSELDGDDVIVPGDQKLVMERDAGGFQSKIEDGPWPAFPADLTSIALALATQSEGTVLIFEKMFENRLFFTDKLSRWAREIILCDPHRAIVIGPRGCAASASSRPTSAPAWRC